MLVFEPHAWMDELFWTAWPCVARWLREQREHARARKLLSVVWKAWVVEAAVPPLVSVSDLDSDDDDASGDAQPIDFLGGPSTLPYHGCHGWHLMMHLSYFLRETAPRAMSTTNSSTSFATSTRATSLAVHPGQESLADVVNVPDTRAAKGGAVESRQIEYVAIPNDAFHMIGPRLTAKIQITDSPFSFLIKVPAEQVLQAICPWSASPMVTFNAGPLRRSESFQCPGLTIYGSAQSLVHDAAVTKLLKSSARRLQKKLVLGCSKCR